MFIITNDISDSNVDASILWNLMHVHIDMSLLMPFINDNSFISNNKIYIYLWGFALEDSEQLVVFVWSRKRKKAKCLTLAVLAAVASTAIRSLRCWCWVMMSANEALLMNSHSSHMSENWCRTTYRRGSDTIRKTSDLCIQAALKNLICVTLGQNIRFESLQASDVNVDWRC